MEELKKLDRDTLISNMIKELPDIRAGLSLSEYDIADKIGMDEQKYRDLEQGNRKMQWSDYMSLLFLFWNNAESRSIIEEKGLFPEKLKSAMTVNRKEHG